MIKITYLFTVAFAVASCKSKSYNYIQVDRDSFSNAFVKREIEDIKAESDSEAYVKAYERYCISKYVNEYAEGEGGIDTDSPVNFELLNNKGENIRDIVIFLDKDRIEKKIDRKTAESVNSSLYGVKSKPTSNSKLNNNTYEIMVQDSQPNVENYHVLIKEKELHRSELEKFVTIFRNEYCKNKCNIYLYDTISVKRLVDKYPLTDKEYLTLADHFVAQSIFELTELDFFPYQDIKYRELGGKNHMKQFVK